MNSDNNISQTATEETTGQVSGQNASQAPSEVPPAPPPSTATVTTLNRKWLIKMLIIMAVSIGLGLFFLVDGGIRYPARGAGAAEYSEFQYLQAFDKERGGIRNVQGIDDPKARLAQLNEKVKSAGQLDGVEQALETWLLQLDTIKQLGPAATAIPRVNYRDKVNVTDGESRLKELTPQWTTSAGGEKKSPTPLSAFDIPSQWVGMVVSLGIGFWLLYVLARAKTRSYRWDPATKRITLPDGVTFGPEDIEEYDKRKWDKLYIALKFKPGHPQLSGKTMEFDLLRHEPLEAWILEQEAVTARGNASHAPASLSPPTSSLPAV